MVPMTSSLLFMMTIHHVIYETQSRIAKIRGIKIESLNLLVSDKTEYIISQRERVRMRRCECTPFNRLRGNQIFHQISDFMERRIYVRGV